MVSVYLFAIQNGFGVWDSGLLFRYGGSDTENELSGSFRDVVWHYFINVLLALVGIMALVAWTIDRSVENSIRRIIDRGALHRLDDDSRIGPDGDDRSTQIGAASGDATARISDIRDKSNALDDERPTELGFDGAKGEA